MLAKLAARNVRRQLGNYLVYFITVSITVALMFAFNSMIFEKQLVARADEIAELRTGLVAITVVVALIVACVLGYATSFMLKLRKREFGTYMTLGMTRANILAVFAVETLVLCAVSLVTGIALGLGLYQGVMAIVTNIMDVQFTAAAYSAQGLLLTLGVVAAVYALSSAASAIYLCRASIKSLVHGERKMQKTVKLPWLWLAVAIVALAAVITGCVLLDIAFESAKTNDGTSVSIFGAAALIAAGIFAFHIGIARSVVGLLLKSKRIKSRGASVFTLRQLSHKLGANSVLAGALALLIAFAVIGANVSFTMKISNDAEFERQYPFDIGAEVATDDADNLSIAEAERIIEKFSPIAREQKYGVYSSGDDYLHGFFDEHYFYGVPEDSFMLESEFDRIYGMKGYAPVALGGKFKIIAEARYADKVDLTGAKLHLGDMTFEFGGMCERFVLGSDGFIAVVPDEAVRCLTRTHDGVAIELENKNIDGVALHDALSYNVKLGDYNIMRCDFNVREYGRKTLGMSSAVFIVSTLYIAIVFVLLAMAILALKSLSGMTDDRKRFDILYKLGAGAGTRKGALFAQIFAFFFLPFALPMMLSIPSWLLCERLMDIMSLTAMTSTSVSIASAGIAAVMLAIYALYFAATYAIAKRNVIANG